LTTGGSLESNSEKLLKLKRKTLHKRALAKLKVIEIQNIPRWKRTLDLMGLVVTVPLLLPVFLLIGAWIKLVSRGPILFRQTRVGQGGQEFEFYKFRSMRFNADTQVHKNHLENLVKNDKPMVKLDNIGDKRVIPGGRFLRASGLDELPQLINVLRGEMSIVGPRPCISSEFPLYLDGQRTRFEVLPGLTGYWQIIGKNRTTFTEMIALDDYYVRHCSPLLDLTIIFLTPAVLFAQVLTMARASHPAGKDNDFNIKN